MLNHSVAVSEREDELGFAIYKLPTTENAAGWNGEFASLCAKKLNASSYVMKFDLDSGPTYHHFKWGVPKDFSHLSPRWVSTGPTFTDAAQAIHSAELDMTEYFDIIVHPVPDHEDDDK